MWWLAGGVPSPVRGSTKPLALRRHWRVTCWLETGRTHQIRVHMSKIGHGLGDPTYGGPRTIRESPERNCTVCGWRIPTTGASCRDTGVYTPRKWRHMFEGPLPTDMRELLYVLRLTSD